MAVRRVNPATPYAIVVRYKPLNGSTLDTIWGYRKRLPEALTTCVRVTRNWLQLVGGQYPVMFWLVIDCRSGREHHPSFSPQGRTSNGQEQPDPGTLH